MATRYRATIKRIGPLSIHARLDDGARVVIGRSEARRLSRELRIGDRVELSVVYGAGAWCGFDVVPVTR
jgi:hypothetical protein